MQNPVSYTHLDVYKRQNENLTTVMGFQNVYLPLTQENSFEPRLSLRYQKTGKGAWSFAYGKHSTMAVSYTHLDVYKRQR